MVTEAIRYYFWDSVSTRQYISLAAIVCLLWEHGVTIEHEYTNIWKSQFTITKCLYLSIRYITLIGQIANHIISSILFSKPALSARTCSVWFYYQTACVQATMTLFEMILLARVWALYNKERRVGYFLAVLQACELGGLIYGAHSINRSVQFDATCLIDHTPKTAIYLAVTPMVMQGIIWSMTWSKRKDCDIREWAASERFRRITHLMLRDGCAVFIVLFTLLTLFLCLTLFVHTMSHSALTVITTVLSVAGCRVIINMQKLKIPMNITGFEMERTTGIGSSCFRSRLSLTSLQDNEYEEGIEPDILLK